MQIKNDYLFYFVYLTKNVVNNKCYVGWHATNNLNDGYIGSGKLLKRSIKKYGVSSHVTGIIEFCNKDTVLNRESFWILEKNTKFPNGYNLTEGGDGGNTYILLSDKDKRKFRENSSKVHKGKKLSDLVKKKISESKLGKPSWSLGKSFSEEHKMHMKEARRKRMPTSEKTKEKMSMSQTGHTYHTQKSKEKISTANSQRIWKEESKNKISQKNKGLKRSEETLLKLRTKYKCIYCGKEMNKSNLSRYHNENCKIKNFISS